MKNQCKFGVGKKGSQNSTKSGFGRVLGSIWEGFGTVWSLSWALLDASGQVFECSNASLNPAWVQEWAPRGLLGRFWIDFARFWGGSETIWDGFGKGFRRIFSIRRPLPVNCPEASRRPSRFPEFCRKSFELFLTASTKQRGGGAAKRTKFEEQKL